MKKNKNMNNEEKMDSEKLTKKKSRRDMLRKILLYF